MSGFTKLVSDILTSSVWQEDSDTRIVWITILALKDKDGFVSASLPGLAHTARVSREACAKAIALFEGPDPDSRTKEYDGRRIEKVNGGWSVLNHWLYRGRLSTDRETAQARERMRRWRNSDDSSSSVTERNVTENGVTLRNTASVSVLSSSSEGGCKGETDFDHFWKAYPRKTAKKAAMKAWNNAKDKPAIDAIIKAIEAQSRSDQWRKDGGQFIPHPTTWLNQGRWADEATRAVKPSALIDGKPLDRSTIV